MTGRLKEGATATDLVLRVTEMLRRANVVGKFVEFYGPGVAGLSVPDRATIGNMAPEYGATIGLFPVDEETCSYLSSTGRPESHVEMVRNYYMAQQMFGLHDNSRIEYSTVLEINLDEIEPSVAGPKRPQDRIPLRHLKRDFVQLLQKPPAEGGYGKSMVEIDRQFEAELGSRDETGNRPLSGGGEQSDHTIPVGHGTTTSKDTNSWSETEMVNNRPTPDSIPIARDMFLRNNVSLRHGSVAIAAITSCTNTSNPSVMLAAGLLAKKAVEMGISPSPYVKTSLAPGSRVVSEYLEKTGLQEYLNRIGFNVVGYGCTTCIGNSGPLNPAIEDLISKSDLILASVLSGNRNFEARIHQSIKANFLMSPPLVVAFALAGRVDIDVTCEPLGRSKQGQDVYLRDLWPKSEDIQELMHLAFDAETYRRTYAGITRQNLLWNEIPAASGEIYNWDKDSTYIQEPPYFENFQMLPGPVAEIRGARPLAILGDSVTTDHISPAGAIRPTLPAGVYLQEKGVVAQDFNSYGSRRGNHEVMVRGTFANVRIKNRMTPGIEGGVTIHYPSGRQMSIYEASRKYREAS
jgi:aconitate hydratase